MNMKKEFLKSGPGKFLVGIFAVWCAVYIFRNGYEFGQFVYAFMH